jgi:hypothetical protein
MPLFADLGPGESYLYHYTSASTLALILDGGSLRLGPYSNTRDPRENKEWWSSFTATDGEDVSPETWDIFEVSRTLDAAIRQRAKLACLTLDRQPSSFSVTHLTRGYARARMWEQYADQHRGAVLIFDRDRLDAAVERTLGHQVLFHGEVQYSDEGTELGLVMRFCVRDTRNPTALRAAADMVIKSHGRSLFFGKNTDWLTECEYRYVAVSDKAEEFVPIKDSLVALVVGMDYPSHEGSVLGYRLERLGVPELPVAQLMWFNGSPSPVPLQTSRG